MKTTCEVWKPVPGYETLYLVSNLGRFKRVSRRTPHARLKWWTLPERELKPINTPRGYQRIVFCSNGQVTNHPAHRIVAQAFVPNPEGYTQVNHIDGVKWNNKAENLEWVSPQQNIQKAYVNGLSRKGQDCSFAKLTEEQVREVFILKGSGYTHASIAKQYGISKSAVTMIVTRRNWKHVQHIQSR